MTSRDADKRKLLDNADMKIIELQTGDIRQTESSAANLSALAVLIWGGLAGFMINRQGTWPSSGELFMAEVLTAIGFWALSIGTAFERRIESAIERSTLARNRLAARAGIAQSELADLGNWDVPKRVSRLIRKPAAMVPRILQLVGLLEVCVGIVLVVRLWPR